MVNSRMKPMANSIGDSKLIEPCHMVAIQLNTFTPVGTAISMVAVHEEQLDPAGMPVANIWCAQTMNERNRDRGSRVHHRGVAEQRLARRRWG